MRKQLASWLALVIGVIILVSAFVFALAQSGVSIF